MIARFKPFFCAIGLMTALAGASGCGLLGVAAYEAEGENVKAEYVPAKENMLVLVENTGGDESGMDADHLQISLVQSLNDNKVAPVVDSQKLEALKDSHPMTFSKLPIDEIGRDVGAKQVLYVNLTKSNIENPNGGATISGEMTAKVRIVDAQTGETRWPVDNQEGETVTADIDVKQNNTSADELKMRRDLGDKLADQISKLFHNYPQNEQKLEPDN